jgi:hypothetical protein
MSIIVNLDEKHVDELHRSGIPDDLIGEAGIRDVPDDEAWDLGFRGSRGASLRGMLFPYLDVPSGEPSERFFRLKPDRPVDKRKYLQPVGEPCRIYFVPGTTPDVLRDAARAILIVEGEKKSLSVEAWRRRCDGHYVVVGIGGAQAWLRKERGLLPDGSVGKIGSKPIDDLNLINWQGRRVVLCLDGDVVTNPDVMWAEVRLVRELRRRGADVHAIRIPTDSAGKRRGADDVLAGAKGASAGTGDTEWNAILSEARVHSGMPLESDRESTYSFGDGIFHLGSNGYELKKKSKDGTEELMPVTNFTIVLDEVIRGEEKDAPTVYRGWLRVKGQAPRPITLDDKTLADGRAFRAAVYRSGYGIELPPRLSTVIPMLAQRLGPVPLEKTSVTSVGRHGERYVFPSIIIDNGHIRENTDCEIANTDNDVLKYDLPLLPICQVPVVAQFVMSQILPLHQPAVMLPLLGCVGLAPLQEDLRQVNFIPHLCGTTGSGKTLVLKVAANFFADIPFNSGLPSVISTINSLEFTGYHLPGLPFFVDDVKRQWLDRHTPEFVRLLQGTYDRHGRGRLDRSARSKRQDYFVRGLMMISGEDFPETVASSTERTLQIIVQADGLARDFKKRIAQIDARRADLRGLTAHYVAWFQRIRSAEPTRLWDAPDFAPTDPRIRPYCQQVLTGLHYFFRFLQEEGGIASEILDRHFEDAVKCLELIAGATRSDAIAQRDHEILIDGVRELLASEACRLLERNHKTEGAGVVIGEKDDDVVNLLPSVVINEIRRLRNLVLNAKSVGQALKESNLLAKLGEDDRPQVNVRISNKVTRVWALKAEVLFPPHEGNCCAKTAWERSDHV